MRQEQEVIFLGGHRKCGTTMFLNLFDGHPGLTVFPTDIRLLYAYYPRYCSASFSRQQQIERLDAISSSLISKVNSSIGSESDEFLTLANEFMSNLPEDLSDIGALLEHLFSAMKMISGENKIAVLKETSIELYAKFLLNRFPKAKFIQLVRDPRDNFAALKSGVGKHYSKLGEDDIHTLFSLVTRYGLSLKVAKDNLELFGAKRYKIVRFEDLVDDTASIMSDVAKWVGVEEDCCLYKPTFLGRDTAGNSHEGLKFNNVSKKNVSRWKERISLEEAAIIEFCMGQEMSSFGYALESSPELRLEAISSFYKEVNYRYLYNDSLKKDESANK